MFLIEIDFRATCPGHFEDPHGVPSVEVCESVPNGAKNLIGVYVSFFVPHLCIFVVFLFHVRVGVVRV